MISQLYDLLGLIDPADNVEGRVAMQRIRPVSRSRLIRPAIGGLGRATAIVAIAFAAGPELVPGPGPSPECFKPWGKDTKYFQWKKKGGPHRIALDNGFIGTT